MQFARESKISTIYARRKVPSTFTKTMPTKRRSRASRSNQRIRSSMGIFLRAIFALLETDIEKKFSCKFFSRRVRFRVCQLVRRNNLPECRVNDEYNSPRFFESTCQRVGKLCTRQKQKRTFVSMGFARHP